MYGGFPAFPSFAKWGGPMVRRCKLTRAKSSFETALCQRLKHDELLQMLLQ
jgi:hypothetical protein